MDAQAHPVDEPNITEVKQSNSEGLNRLLWICLGVGVVYIAGVAVYGISTRPNLKTQLARYLKVPPHTKVDVCDISGAAYSSDVNAEFDAPPGMSQTAFKSSLEHLNGLTWTKEVVTPPSNISWKTVMGGLQYQLSATGKSRHFRLSITGATVYPIKSAGPSVSLPGGPSLAPAYPARIGGTRSSIGSPGPSLPKSVRIAP